MPWVVAVPVIAPVSAFNVSPGATVPEDTSTVAASGALNATDSAAGDAPITAFSADAVNAGAPPSCPKWS